MKIYRTRDAIMDGTVRQQLLEEVVWAFLDNETMDFYEIEIPADAQEEALDALFKLIDEKLITEDCGKLALVDPVSAFHVVGLYPGWAQHLIPDGVEAYCLSDEVETLLDNNSVGDVAEYLLVAGFEEGEA